MFFQFNTILKDQLISSVTDLDVSVCQVISFIRSNSVGVEAKVSLTLSDFSVLDSILELIVPGIDVSIKTASLISEKGKMDQCQLLQLMAAYSLSKIFDFFDRKY